ncbi:hypothetical protein PG993_014060 [Apiospora rasikravindrae]|uniref:Uncharacterized protein n=1 Tax=Apiospora rasikravindrae TaxID=990691 RepID=A0ABR1RT42_9PEZI
MLSTTALALFASTAAAAAVVSSSSSSKPADACSTQTVCADYVNACGQMYGGCFSACTPWPTFTPPPCTISTTAVTPSPTITSAPPSVKATSTSTDGGLPCGGSRLCADHVRTCGTTAVLTFGGCYPACSPSPLYTAPPCPTGAPGPGVTPPPAAGKPCNRSTACQDLLRTCGTSTVLTYGGCWPACSPKPTFSAPPCPTATPTSRRGYV